MVRAKLYKKLRSKIPDDDLAIYGYITTNTRMKLGESTFEYNRGVDQGAILSPMMFALL